MSAGEPIADVCLIVEGTYPFVRGGVSSWVHNLLIGMPDLRFAILLVSATRTERKPAYELPSNVVRFVEVFIHEAVVHTDPTPGRRKQKRFWEAVREFHICPHAASQVRPFRELLTGLTDPDLRVENTADVLFSRRAWDYMVERYESRCPESSFIDFVWTWRAIHTPLLQLLNAEIPLARVYHLVSTGYAGLLGVLARYRHHRPTLLTEHGIYVRERMIDIARADWIHEEAAGAGGTRRMGVLKELWTRFFMRVGQLTYAHCDEVLTLFGGNRDLQVELGCPKEKLRVVPNGVNVELFRQVRKRARPEDGIRRIGLVGRVVPIKDIKTFVKACAIISRAEPETEFYVCGPIDEEPEYYSDCLRLKDALGLDTLYFTGTIDVREYFPKLDVFVLTSISEGQPLTVLEAACAGVPTVATDVGACRELVEGYTQEDRALGRSGLITRVGDPEATAKAVLELLGNEKLRQHMIRSGVERVERYYRQEEVVRTYQALYGRWHRAPDREMP